MTEVKENKEKLMNDNADDPPPPTSSYSKKRQVISMKKRKGNYIFLLDSGNILCYPGMFAEWCSHRLHRPRLTIPGKHHG